MLNMLCRFRKAAPLLVLAATLGSAGVPSHAASGVRVPQSICFWEDLDWTEMTRGEQAVWRELGWSQVSWDSGDETLAPPSQDKDWNELDGSERAAAQAFGYTARTWDNDTCGVSESGGAD